MASLHSTRRSRSDGPEQAREWQTCGYDAGPVRRAGHSRRRGGRRPLGDHRHLRFQRIAGRRQPEARHRAAAGYSRDRPCGHRPELSRQFERRRKIIHQHRRPRGHDGSRSGGNRRSIRRDRDGDPPGAGGSRRRRRLHGHHRNEAGLETPDLMSYFAADPSIRVIVVYLEGVRNTKVFREACKAARAAGKPVIALKLGASEGGRAAAMAHTGALAGSIETFDAISTREGVIRVRGLDELIETTECFVHAKPPKSDRLAAVSLSGGKRGLLIDAFHSAGLNFAPLSSSATEKLAKMLGPGSIVGNPLDAGFAAVVDPSVYMQSIKIFIDDPDTDIVIIDAELPKAPHELRERNLRIVNDMAGAASKPVVYISAMSIGFTEFTKP